MVRMCARCHTTYISPHPKITRAHARTCSYVDAQNNSPVVYVLITWRAGGSGWTLCWGTGMEAIDLVFAFLEKKPASVAAKL